MSDFSYYEQSRMLTYSLCLSHFTNNKVNFKMHTTSYWIDHLSIEAHCSGCIHFAYIENILAKSLRPICTSVNFGTAFTKDKKVYASILIQPHIISLCKLLAQKQIHQMYLRTPKSAR